MTYHWTPGFPAPKGVTVEQAWEAINALPEPTPEALYEASKRKRHPLHEHLWSEGDQVWAQRARVEYCRKLIGAVQETVVVGGKSISVRAVEFVKTNDGSKWATLETIRSDPALLDGYLAEVQRLQEQATAKMVKARELMRPSE